MNKLKIAIQKSGRLSEKSLELLKECGIKIPDFKSKLKNSATNFPLEILFLRDDDIPKYVEQGIVDIGAKDICNGHIVASFKDRRYGGSKLRQASAYRNNCNADDSLTKTGHLTETNPTIEG